MSASNAIKPKWEEDLIRASLAGALFSSFLHAGYSPQEATKLRDIAIGPVSSALDAANYAYKMHLDALNVILPEPIFLRKP